MPNQLPLFPVRTSPLARRAHPVTSKMAAQELLADPERLGSLQRAALEAVNRHPGCTTHELARLSGLDDERTLGRRLSELAPKYVYADGFRRDPKSGKRCQLWWPSPKEAA